MTLTDASTLIALLDSDDPGHAECRRALDTVRFPLATTWPAFTEAMHILGRAGGWSGQAALWQLVEQGDLVVEAPSAPAVERAASLMQTYSDRPMDLADATLVALAEERELSEIFTLDNDFRFYRLNGRRHFALLPG
jgi:predicted nucleic acid-binding protein